MVLRELNFNQELKFECRPCLFFFWKLYPGKADGRDFERNLFFRELAELDVFHLEVMNSLYE
jgi:hypothetical protein